MKKQEEKITVTCPKCGEEIDIQDILEKRKVRNYFEKMISDDRVFIKEMVIKKEWFETETSKIQSKIEKLSENNSEEDKNTISKLQAQKCDIEQIKQKITELIDGLEKQIKSFETEINNNNFTCPKCGEEIDNIEDLLKKRITFYHEQTELLNKIHRLTCQLKVEEEKIHQLSQKQAIFEKEREQIKTMINELSEIDSEKKKNMVPKLVAQQVVLKHRREENMAEIEKTKEKIMSLQGEIESLQGEIK